jgi:hypothetical protein
MEHFQWVLALTRLVSAVWRKGGDSTFLVEELKNVFDPKGGYYKRGGVYMPSLVAEIGTVIEQHLVATGVIKVEVVQLFLSDKVSSLIPAGKRLKGFEKITLEANETKRVDFTISKEDLMFADQNGKWMLEPGAFSIEIGSLETTFELK